MSPRHRQHLLLAAREQASAAVETRQKAREARHDPLARAEKPRIAERCDDGGVGASTMLGEHLERDGPADLSLGARRDVGHAALGRDADELGAGRRDRPTCIEQPLGHGSGGVWD
jgi:hypothetical protein